MLWNLDTDGKYQGTPLRLVSAWYGLAPKRLPVALAWWSFEMKHVGETEILEDVGRVAFLWTKLGGSLSRTRWIYNHLKHGKQVLHLLNAPLLLVIAFDENLNADVVNSWVQKKSGKIPLRAAPSASAIKDEAELLVEIVASPARLPKAQAVARNVGKRIARDIAEAAPKKARGEEPVHPCNPKEVVKSSPSVAMEATLDVASEIPGQSSAKPSSSTRKVPAPLPPIFVGPSPDPSMKVLESLTKRKVIETASVLSTSVEVSPPTEVQEEAFSEDATKADGADERLVVAIAEEKTEGEDVLSNASGGDDLKDPDYVDGALEVAAVVKKKRAPPQPKASTKKDLVAVPVSAAKGKRKKKDDQLAVMVPMDKEDANSKLINRKTLELAESKIKEHSQWYPFGLNKYYQIPARLIDNPRQQ
ncbi:unnamed protein product [Calypogeia fissa]